MPNLSDAVEWVVKRISALKRTVTDADLTDSEYMAVDNPSAYTRKITVASLAMWVLGRIKSLATRITSFRTGDVIPVDGPGGPAKMGKDDLLRVTAQSSLAGNVSPEFDPTKPNDEGGYAYYAGTNVTYEGQNFVFVANHKTGPWNPSEVEHKPLSESINLQGVGEAVANWLDEHPEATTTVEDSSLTEAKFSDRLKLQTIKDYVTPEMFGAVGDGVTDDTAAFESALAAHSTIVGTNGHIYAIQGIYVDKKSLYNCVIKPVAGYTGDGITIHGRTYLFNCRVVSFRNNLVFASGTIYSEIDFCRFAEAKICNVYINRASGYATANVIRNCHILSAAVYTADDSSPEYGCGIYIQDFVLGLLIEGCTLENNKKYGIRFNYLRLTYLSGFSAIGNYFEHHQLGDITLHMASESARVPQVYINGNVYGAGGDPKYICGIVLEGTADPNVFESTYEMFDYLGKVIGSVQVGPALITTFREHMPVLNADTFASSMTIKFFPAYRPESSQFSRYVKITYVAKLNTDFSFTGVVSDITAHLSSGPGECFVVRTMRASRALVDDEFIQIMNMDILPATNP